MKDEKEDLILATKQQRWFYNSFLDIVMNFYGRKHLKDMALGFDAYSLFVR